MTTNAHQIGRHFTFAGKSDAGLLPFGSTWETSDGYAVQCVSVGHNVNEAGHYIGRGRVIGFAQRILQQAGPSTPAGRLRTQQAQSD